MGIHRSRERRPSHGGPKGGRNKGRNSVSEQARITFVPPHRKSENTRSITMISRVSLVVSGGPCNYKEVISDQFIVDVTARQLRRSSMPAFPQAALQQRSPPYTSVRGILQRSPSGLYWRRRSGAMRTGSIDPAPTLHPASSRSIGKTFCGRASDAFADRKAAHVLSAFRGGSTRSSSPMRWSTRSQTRFRRYRP